VIFDFEPVLEVTRGETVESVHLGSVAVVDADGRLLFGWGNPGAVAFLRSSAKPFQAISVIESGAADAYALSPRQLAVICASHTGSDEHVEVVSSILSRVGLPESALLCGTHPPDDFEARERLLAQGLEPTPVRHMCSGKHSGMLALSRHLAAPVSDYLELGHACQQLNLHTLAEMCDLSPSDIEVGIDGCSVPTFALPLRAAALGFARLADPRRLAAARVQACTTVFQAMVSHPVMVHGRGQFDTRLMEVTRGRVLCKRGAEGYSGLALSPGALGANSPGIGIAAKILDGDLGRRSDVPPGNRAGTRVVLKVLDEMGVLDETQMAALAEFGPQPVVNKRRLEVGMMRTCFSLRPGTLYDRSQPG
jgi:L-asparaginase II